MMPWVDPETVGPQKYHIYAWNFALFAIPNIFLISAVLFAVATSLRSMMAAYIGAIVIVMGYLVHEQRSSPEDRASADGRPLGAARHRRASGSDALLDPERDEHAAGRA